MCGVDIKHCVLMFALFEEGEMGLGVCVFLDELGYDSFDSGVKSGLLTKGGEKLGESPVRAID